MKKKNKKTTAVTLILIAVATVAAIVLAEVLIEIEKKQFIKEIVIMEGEEHFITGTNYSIILKDAIPMIPSTLGPDTTTATIEIRRDSEFFRLEMLSIRRDVHKKARFNNIEIDLRGTGEKSAKFSIYKK